MPEITRRDFFLRTSASTGLLFLVGFETGCSLSTLVAALQEIATALQASTPILETLLPPPWNLLLPGLAALIAAIAGVLGSSSAILLAKSTNALHQSQQLQSRWSTLKVEPNYMDRFPDTPLSALIETSPRELVRQVINGVNSFLLQTSMTVPGVETKMQADNAIFALKVPTAVSYALKSYASPIPLARSDKGMLINIYNNAQAIQQKVAALGFAHA